MARKRSAKERVAPAGSIRRIRATVQEGRPMRNAGMRAEASRGSAGIPRENDAPRRQEVGRHGGRRSALEGERRAMSTTARPSPRAARVCAAPREGNPKQTPRSSSRPIWTSTDANLDARRRSRYIGSRRAVHHQECGNTYMWREEAGVKRLSARGGVDCAESARSRAAPPPRTSTSLG